MRIRYLTAILALTASCGSSLEICEGWNNSMSGKTALRFREPEIALELIPIVEEYLGLAKSLNLNTDGFYSLKAIKFDDTLLGKIRLGECRYFTVPHRTYSEYYTEIALSPILSDDQIPFVLFHELTHCIFNKDHSTVEGSIMYPTVSDSFDWEIDKDFLIDQMFDFIKYGD